MQTIEITAIHLFDADCRPNDPDHRFHPTLTTYERGRMLEPFCKEARSVPFD
ncbi:hypothetical protein EKH55_4200 [Sinorhizobium alkalisoli]|nr:hypothetical protein EKH55_4200 [Sinorhizobium alkalisoli]